MHPYIKQVLEIVQKRNQNEPTFLQAVDEVLETLDPVIEEYPKIEEFNLLERMCEPERQHIFKVTWEDDQKNLRVNRGFRVAFNGTLGPYKGGIRFHPTVNLGVLKFLAFEQTFKNSLTGLQIGGGKGGSDFDPKGKSEREIMRFCHSFMTELARYLGPNIDVPAGDIGVGGREVGYFYGQYRHITGRYDLGVLTGKDISIGGSLARKQATGYGCVYFAQEMLTRKGEGLKGKTAVVSGSGNVALYTIEKLQQLGAKVVACSDSDGYIYDPQGLNFEHLHALKELDRKRLHEYTKKYPKAHFKEDKKVWEVPCDLAFPCAIQNELDSKDAEMLIKNKCILVSEGANMPVTPDAIRILQKKHVLYAPGKAANAGGVAVSALEMQQNACWSSWTFQEVDNKLHDIMKEIHRKCVYYSEKYEQPNNYVVGANIAGFLRVVDGMLAQAVY